MNAPGPGPFGQLPPGSGPGYTAAYVPPPGWSLPQRSWRQWHAYGRAHLEANRPVEQLYAEMAMTGMSQADGMRLVREITAAMRKRALLITGFGVLAVLAGVALIVAALAAGTRSSAIGWLVGVVLTGLISGGRGIYELNRIPKV